MPKHHLKNLAEQMADKGYASSPFHFERNFNTGAEPMISQDDQTKEEGQEDSLKIRAYQIHQEKGGSDLDNWLQAEQEIKNPLSVLINEGDPNTQRIN